MRNLKIFYKIIRKTGALHALLIFFAFMLTVALILSIIEPQINSWGEGIWYCFTAITTIGFGDVCAVTKLGRILTMMFACYGICIIAIFTGALASFYSEIMMAQKEETVTQFMDRLEHLETLSEEELSELSQKIRDYRKKR